MRSTAIIMLAAGATALGLAGCGSTTTATEPSVATTAAPAPAVASSPAPSTCPEFAMTAAHMATDWQYLNLNLGTTNDEQPTLDDLSTGAAALQSLAPECAPKAVDAVAAFADTVEPVRAVYTTQPTGEDVQRVDDALAAMQEAGAQMFTDMGMATYSWE